jgi:hypothetical protein
MRATHSTFICLDNAQERFRKKSCSKTNNTVDAAHQPILPGGEIAMPLSNHATIGNLHKHKCTSGRVESNIGVVINF